MIYPTGSGKSAIFQVASRVLADSGLGSAGVVVSPLRALMHDQVEAARRRGLKAYYIDSGVPPSEREAVLEAFRAGVVDLLYITPERFRDPTYEEILREGEPSLVVLDEAHTLSRWGMSFRPSYLDMARLIREARSGQGEPVPVAAFTATAPGDVEADILDALGYEPSGAVRLRVDLDDPSPRVEAPPGRAVVLRAPPLRREIHLDVRLAPRDPRERLEDLSSLVAELAEWASRVSEPWVGVVFTGYVRSRRMPWANADSVARALESRLGRGVVAVYHGQLPAAERRRIEEAVAAASRGSRRGPRVIVATKAFGMGVDIPNIRFVVHFTPPDSVEDYYQEVGRAGRDRLEAYAVAYYDPDDYKARLALKLREAPRPSDAIQLYNLIASLAVEGEAVLPMEAARALLGEEARILRALEMLRRAGLLEYTIKAGAPALDAGYCDARLRRGCVAITQAPGAEAALEWRLCQAPWGLGAAVYSDGKRLAGPSGCRGGQGVPGARGRYILAYLSPDAPREPSQSLPPGNFALLLRAYSLEASKPEQLMRIMEDALAARLQGGQAAADARLRRAVEEALEKPPLARPPGDPSRLLGGRVTCGGPVECARQAARKAVELEALVGPRGYTLASPSQELSATLKREAEAALGRVVPSPLKAYRSVLSTARRGGPVLLANKGVILILLEEGSRSMEAVERNLAGYPYLWLYLVGG